MGVAGQLFMLSLEMLKSKIPKIQFLQERGSWQPTFDAESRNAKIQISIFTGGRGRGQGAGDQLLILSPEMLKSKIPIFVGGLAANF